MADGQTYDYTQDPDFLSAPTSQQHSYLMENDPDYAKSPSTTQDSYLSHLRESAPLPKAPQPLAGNMSKKGLFGENISPAEEERRIEMGGQIQNESITPMTNAIGAEAPVATAGAVIGSKIAGYGGKAIAPHVGLSPETGEAAGGLVGGLIGGHMAGGTPPGTPEPAGVIGRAIAPEVAPGMSEGATSNMLEDIQARRGTEKMFQAAAPSAGDMDFRERLSSAAPDLSQLAKDKPLTSGGGIINPDFRPREFVTNLSDYMDDLWNKEYAPQIKEAADAPAPLEEVKQSMKQTISQVDKEKNPGLVQSLQDELDRMPERETVAQMEARRVQLSDKLNRYYKASPSDQVAMENQNFNVAATKAEYDAVLDTLDRTLKLNGQAGGMGPRGRYGNLAEVRNYISKQVNPTEQATIMQHIGQMFFRRGPERLITGALANPSAGRQVGQGMGLLGKSSLFPEITPGPSEPWPRPPQLPENAGPRGLTPMERGPAPGSELRPGITPAGGTKVRSTIGAPISSLEPSEAANQPKGIGKSAIGTENPAEPRKVPNGEQTGRPVSDIRDKQATIDKLTKILNDPAASAIQKAGARNKLRDMGVAETGKSVSTTTRSANVGKRNIGRPVNRQP